MNSFSLLADPIAQLVGLSGTFQRQRWLNEVGVTLRDNSAYGMGEAGVEFNRPFIKRDTRQRLPFRAQWPRPRCRLSARRGMKKSWPVPGERRTFAPSPGIRQVRARSSETVAPKHVQDFFLGRSSDLLLRQQVSSLTIDRLQPDHIFAAQAPNRDRQYMPCCRCAGTLHVRVPA